MALIKPSPNQEKVSFKVKIGKNTSDEIEAYCQWVVFKDKGEFVEKLFDFMIDKDQDWKKHRKEMTES